MNDEVKEWVKVSRSANNVTVVTVSLVDGNHSVKWSSKTYSHQIKRGLMEARSGAHQALADLKTAIAELEEEEAA